MTTFNLNLKTDEELAEIAQQPFNRAVAAEASEILVTRYLDLTGHIARAFPIRGVDVEDRQAACWGGLAKAIQHYQSGRGTKFKTYAKRLMGRCLIDLHRTVHQAGEVPPSAMRSLDLAVGDDGDEMSLMDVIAGDEDTEARAMTRAEAVEVGEQLAWDQWLAFLDALDNQEAEAAALLIDSVRQYARLKLVGSQLADLEDLLDGPPQVQMALFTMAPKANSAEARQLAWEIFQGYAALQWAILQDLIQGYKHPEIASRQTFREGVRIRPELVGQIIRGLQAMAGIESDPDPMALAA